MNTRPNDAAFVRPASEITRAAGAVRPTDGLSNREYFASLALQGLLTGAGDNDFSYDDAAEDAVTYADALIAALNKKAGTS